MVGVEMSRSLRVYSEWDGHRSAGAVVCVQIFYSVRSDEC